MKKILTLSFLIFVTFPSFSQTLSWSNEMNVDNGNMYGNLRPRIAVTANNVPIIMWGGGSSTEPLYVARWNGASFNSPVQVTPANVDPFIDTWAGADIAAKGNTAYVVFKVQPEMTSNIYIVKSTDGGATWSDTTRVDNMSGPYDRFPSVAVTSSGDPAVIYMSFDMSWNNAAYIVVNSTDGGATFPVFQNASTLGSSNVCDCCPGYLTINGSNQAAAWRRNNSNIRDMWAGISTNSGMNFTTGLDVDNTNWMLSACPSSGPSPFLDNDSLFTVFMSGASGDNRIYFNSHNITTQANGYTAMLDPTVPSADIQNYPFIAGNGDTVGVVWQNASNGNVDTWFSWSIGGTGGLFSNKVMINTTTAGSQQNPHIAYSNGTFHFTWADYNSGNVMYRKATIIPNGINDQIENTIHISTWPNPSSDNMMLCFDQPLSNDAEITLTDVSGNIVEKFAANGQRNIQLSHHDAGVYFVSVISDGRESVSRIIFY
jgi:hypothetical protein